MHLDMDFQNFAECDRFAYRIKVNYSQFPTFKSGDRIVKALRMILHPT